MKLNKLTGIAISLSNRIYMDTWGSIDSVSIAWYMTDSNPFKFKPGVF